MDIKELVSKFIPEIDSPEKVYELFHGLKYPKDKVLNPTYMRKIEGFDFAKEERENFKESLKTNTKSNLKLLFKKLFDEVMADMYENDFNFYKKIEENQSAKELIKENLFEDVFKRGKEVQI